MENERIAIGKKLRFEVFKRDNFTCNYCGRKAPEIILHVDHIVPVSGGGTNDILNLITSCFECNLGKSNRPLSENTVLEKQRRQLEELAERREQIEMMFEWQKSLSNLEGYTLNLLVDYIEGFIPSYSLNEHGRSKIEKLLKKFPIQNIFKAIDISKTTYLKYGKDGVLIKESVEDYINKIYGIAVNSNRPPIESKMHYIKGICKNRFSYWNDASGFIIIKNYVKALKDAGWSDGAIVDDLTGEAAALARNATNWTQWRTQMEGWTQDLINQANSRKDTAASNQEKVWSENELKTTAEMCIYEMICMAFDFYEFLSLPFGGTPNRDTSYEIYNNFADYVKNQVDSARISIDKIHDFMPSTDLVEQLGLTQIYENRDGEYHGHSLEVELSIISMCKDYFPHWVYKNLYFPGIGISKVEEINCYYHYFCCELKEQQKRFEEYERKMNDKVKTEDYSNVNDNLLPPRSSEELKDA